MLAPGFGERFVRSLYYALAANVDPRTGRHLAVHHQALALQFVEMLPARPFTDKVGIGQQQARGRFMRAQDAHRLTRLDKQRFVILQALKSLDDGVETLP